MTVKELKEKLINVPDNATLYVTEFTCGDIELTCADYYEDNNSFVVQ
jgi:hypothetical protein